MPFIIMERKQNTIKALLKKRFDVFYYFYSLLGRKIITLLALTFMMAMLDSLGITMFVPLLKVADGTRNMVGGTHEKFMAIMQRAFDYLHLDLSLLNMLFLIVLIFVLKAVFVYGAKRYQVITMQEIVRNIRTKLSRGLRDLSYKEFVQTDVGQLQNTLTGES